MMPFSFSANSSAASKSGDAQQGGSGTGNGFYVNYGDNVTQGGGGLAPAGAGMPLAVWAGVAIIVGVLVWKRLR